LHQTIRLRRTNIGHMPPPEGRGNLSSMDLIHRLLAAGVDVFRVNSSHGTRDDRRAMVERIRRRTAGTGRIVAVLQDLAGPKIRIGPLVDPDGIELKAGSRLRIAVGDFAGAAGRVSTSCAPLAAAVRGGEALLLDDGAIGLRVIASDGVEIVTEVEFGGLLTARKGINAPGVDLPLAAVTEADVGEIGAAAAIGVDFLGVSFVQSGDDLRQARAVARRCGGDHVALVAKIERPEAVERFDDILSAADAVMVARGDLGLEIPLEQVPRVQKDLTRRARDAGVPLIVATQVLDTMRHAPRPTRAEVSDAANAVDDGVDAIMLAGETAAGEYPVLAVQTLDAVLRDAESAQPDRVVPGDIGDRHDRALCDAAVTLAAAAGATAIVAVTGSGTTARQLAALRPPIPVYAFTADDDVARRLALYRSVAPLVAPADRLVVGQLKPELSRRGIVRAGDAVVIARVHSDLEVEDANFVELQRF
jgi:pyruvate kinase